MKIQTNLTELQATWYKILNESGFKDIEDENQEYLKSWSGVSQFIEVNGECIDLLDLHLTQEPLNNIKSSFPEPILTEAESLLHHPKLQDVCINICSHWNHSLNPEQVKEILFRHTEGQTERLIGQELNLNDTLIHRTIKTLLKWAKVMPGPEELETVIIRRFNEDLDIPFIYSTWRDTLWFDEKRNDEDSPEFYRTTNRQIKKILNKPNIIIKIACLKNDPNFIVGYAVMTEENLEWVYVKFDFRGDGVANLLCKHIKSITYPFTKVAKEIIQNKKHLTHE